MIVDASRQEEQVGLAHQGQAQSEITQIVHRQEGARLPRQVQVPLRPLLRQYEHQQFQVTQRSTPRFQIPHGKEQSHRCRSRQR